MSDLLTGKNVVVMGVFNRNSIAWGIAEQLAAYDARVHLTYQREEDREKINKLAQTIGATISKCEVTDEEDVARLPIDLPWDTVDFLAHSLAFAPPSSFAGRFHEISREDFLTAQDISAYSLIAVVRALKEKLSGGGSVATISYLASRRPIPGYNAMTPAKGSLESIALGLAQDLGPEEGIRVNVISPGPTSTISARGVPGARTLTQRHASLAPLRRPMDTDDVGGAAVYLASHLSKNVTGQILFVDGGYSICGAFPEPEKVIASE